MQVQQSQGDIIQDGGLYVPRDLLVPLQALREGHGEQLHNHHRQIRAPDEVNAYELDYVRMTQFAQITAGNAR